MRISDDVAIVSQGQRSCALLNRTVAVVSQINTLKLLMTCVRRIAANEPSFLSGHLRVQDQRDKQKLNIKALDVVLFGPPTRKNNSLPALIFVFLFQPTVPVSQDSSSS